MTAAEGPLLVRRSRRPRKLPGHWWTGCHQPTTAHTHVGPVGSHYVQSLTADSDGVALQHRNEGSARRRREAARKRTARQLFPDIETVVDEVTNQPVPERSDSGIEEGHDMHISDHRDANANLDDACEEMAQMTAVGDVRSTPARILQDSPELFRKASQTHVAIDTTLRMSDDEIPPTHTAGTLGADDTALHMSDNKISPTHVAVDTALRKSDDEIPPAHGARTHGADDTALHMSDDAIPQTHGAVGTALRMSDDDISPSDGVGNLNKTGGQHFQQKAQINVENAPFIDEEMVRANNGNESKMEETKQKDSQRGYTPGGQTGPEQEEGEGDFQVTPTDTSIPSRLPLREIQDTTLRNTMLEAEAFKPGAPRKVRSEQRATRTTRTPMYTSPPPPLSSTSPRPSVSNILSDNIPFQLMTSARLKPRRTQCLRGEMRMVISLSSPTINIGELRLCSQTCTGSRRVSSNTEENFIVSQAFAGVLECTIRDRKVILRCGDYLSIPENECYQFNNAGWSACTLHFIQMNN